MIPITSLAMLMNRKISVVSPCWEMNLSHPTHSLVTILTELPLLSWYRVFLVELVVT